MGGLIPLHPQHSAIIQRSGHPRVMSAPTWYLLVSHTGKASTEANLCFRVHFHITLSTVRLKEAFCYIFLFHGVVRTPLLISGVIRHDAVSWGENPGVLWDRPLHTGNGGVFLLELSDNWGSTLTTTDML